MKRTPLKRKTPLKRGPWRRKPKLRDAVSYLDQHAKTRDLFVSPSDMALARRLRAGNWNVRTPKLKPKQPTAFQRHSWMKRESDKRKLDRQIYTIQRAIFLKANPWCQMNVTCGAIVIKRNIPGVEQVLPKRRATQIHHTHGRGKFYLVVETWKGGCTACHRWENDHRNEAVELGLRVRVR